MLQTPKGRKLDSATVNDLVAPALNLARAIELDLLEHPACPYRDTARKAATGLMILMSLAKDQQ